MMKKIILSVALAFSAFNAIAQDQAVLSAYEKIKQNYVDPVDEKIMAPGTIKGMVDLLDAHSGFFDAAELKSTKTVFSGGAGGAGIGLVPENGRFFISAPFKSSPAFDAGVKRGDFLVAVDGKKLDGLSLADAFNLTTGAPGSKVNLTVERSGTGTLNFTVTRDVVTIKTIVASEFIDPGCAYIKIKGFGADTSADFSASLADLIKQNNGLLKGLVLDLRGNQGGLLNSAIGVTAAFLPENALVVYTEGRTADANKRITATKGNYLRSGETDYIKALPDAVKSLPVVVLTNGSTASAAELVAGALQAHKRATIIGTGSYGKGTGQKLVPLDDGSAIKLTYFRYFLPNGQSIQARGVVPDILVDDGEVFKREVNTERHLPAITTGVSASNEVARAVSKDDAAGSKRSDDVQLKRAIDFIKTGK